MKWWTKTIIYCIENDYLLYEFFDVEVWNVKVAPIDSRNSIHVVKMHYLTIAKLLPYDRPILTSITQHNLGKI